MWIEMEEEEKGGGSGRQGEKKACTVKISTAERRRPSINFHHNLLKKT